MNKISVLDEDYKVICEVSNKQSFGEEKKKRKIKEEYIEDSKDRSQSRCKRRKGLALKIAQLKLLTGDDVYVEIHHSKTQEVKVLCTSPYLLSKKKSKHQHPQQQQQPILTPLTSPTTQVNPTPFANLLNEPILPIIPPTSSPNFQFQTMSTVFHPGPTSNKTLHMSANNIQNLELISTKPNLQISTDTIPMQNLEKTPNESNLELDLATTSASNTQFQPISPSNQTIPTNNIDTLLAILTPSKEPPPPQNNSSEIDTDTCHVENPLLF